MLRRLLYLFMLITVPAFAANAVYVGQNAAGLNDGSSCSNEKAVTYFNNSLNWSATPTGIQIGPATTVHVCGALTTALTAQANGSAGNVVTILFETGAKMSTTVFPVTGAVDVSNRSYITIDGGVACGPSVAEGSCNGTIENTANGTGLANHTDQTIGIRVAGADHITILNMLVRNIYVHNLVTDVNVPSQPLPTGIYGNGVISNITIHDSKLHDANWMISFADSSVESHMLLYSNEIYNSDHCYAQGVTTQTDDDVVLHDNTCRDGNNWDTTANVYHHDGFHFYTTGAGKITNVVVYNNTFKGFWGTNNTSAIFVEGPSAGEVDTTIYNNRFLQDTTAFNWNNGFINVGNLAGTNPSTTKLYNNTFIAGTGQHAYMVQLAYAVDVRNNVFVTSDTANGVTINALSTVTGTINYNAYASTQSTPFEIASVGKSYAQWQSAGWDANGPVGNVGTPPFNITAANGQPSSSFIGVVAGLDLTSLSLTPLDSDIFGNSRGSGSPWTIGALNVTVTPAYKVKHKSSFSY